MNAGTAGPVAREGQIEMAGSQTFRTSSWGATATLTREPSGVRLVVAGDVDAALAETADAVLALVAEERGPIEVDLSGVTLFGAAGITWLLELDRVARGGVVVVAASDCVREVAGLCDVPFLAPPRGGAS